MDLTGQGTINTTWTIDPITNVLTLSFLDHNNTTLGTLVLESNKFNSMMKALGEMGIAFFPDSNTQVNCRTILNLTQVRGTSVFG